MARRALSGALVALALAATMLLVPVAGADAARSYPTGFSDRVLATGLGAPTGVAWAPDGRMFVAEKDGKLDVIEPGSTSPTQVLDISARVNHAGDRGLLSVAVDANYNTNNYVYLLYTYELEPFSPDENGPMVSRLERFRITPGNVATSDKVLLGNYVDGPCPPAANSVDCIPSDDSSHSIGTVRADPDGTLWVGSGDAASFGFADQLALRTYDEQSMAGKIMHIDRDGKGLTGHPFCPGRSPDNLDDVCAKLYAKGFRNPYRFTLRPPGKSGVVVGDVGWNQREEVDVVAQGGGNYGWPCYEAGQRTPDYRDWPECGAEYAKEGTADADIGPSYEYPHPVGNTVIGGPTYTGQRYPASMDGNVFYGDYTAKTIRRLVLDDQDRVVDDQDFASGFEGMVGLEQAPNGNLVGVDIGTFSNDGTVREIVYQGREPEAVASATPTSGPTPLTVDFTGSASYDADSQDLTYDWNFGDGSAHSSAADPQHVYTTTGTYTATLTVTDRDGNSATDTVTISPGNDAPTATIAEPANGSLYRDGSTITLRGSGTDPQTPGSLPGSALSWQVLLHHGDHIHPLHQATGTETSFTAAPDHDADSYYEVVLTAKDSSGLTGTRSITLRPETTQARITSTPAGAPITYSGRDFTAPLNVATAIGFRTSLSADVSFVRDGRTYYFDRWSDGGPRTRNGLTVPPSGLDLRAFYREDKAAGQSATASTTQAPHDSGDAVDGNAATYWGSEFADDQYWQVDLGRQRQVDQVRLDWTAAYPSQYKVQTSPDGTTWSDAATVNVSTVPHGDPKGVVETSFGARVARYVRIRSVVRATEWGIAFFDARVLGPTDLATPDTTISSGPSGPTQQRDATWAFTSDPGATFECKLDAGSWQPCTAPKTVTGLADGSHTFQVRAVGDAGEDPTPASRTVVVSTPTPPTGGDEPPTTTAPKAPPKAPTSKPKPKAKPTYASTLMGTRGLKALFGLGDAGTRAKDSNGGRAGRFHGSPRRVRRLTGAGGSGWARAFDGRNDRLELDSSSLGRPKAFSVELWVKAVRRNRTGYLLTAAADRRRDGFSLALDRKGRALLVAAGRRPPARASRLVGPALDTRLRHLVVTYDGRRLRLYVDGRLRETSGAITLTWSHARHLVLGADENGENDFKGTLDELSLYDRALPAATVASHRNAGR